MKKPQLKGYHGKTTCLSNADKKAEFKKRYERMITYHQGFQERMSISETKFSR